MEMESRLVQLAGRSPHSIRARMHANIFGKVVPANNFRSVDQKLLWTSNGVPVLASSDVKQVVISVVSGSGRIVNV
jgi:hypothetical protein